MKRKIFLIAGTRDGRELAQFLIQNKFEVTASVVSDYGRKLLEDIIDIKIISKPFKEETLRKLLHEGNYEILVDASHPYAQNVSTTAIFVTNNLNILYIRYERASTEVTYKKKISVSSYEEAASKAAELGKNIFITTGSRNLKIFREAPSLNNCHLIVRILPTTAVLKECEQLGFRPNQIVAMQGPFSTELNKELFKQFEAEVIITKDSGQIGGSDTKIEAARSLNLPIIMIERPKILYPNITRSFVEVLELINEKESTNEKLRSTNSNRSN